MLTPDNAVLVVVDVQGKLAQLMADKETVFANIQRMIRGAQALSVPILWADASLDVRRRALREVPAASGGGASDSKSVQIDSAGRRVANIQTATATSQPLTRKIRAVGELFGEVLCQVELVARGCDGILRIGCGNEDFPE